MWPDLHSGRSSRRGCSEDRCLRAAAEKRAHTDLVVLPIDVWLGILDIGGCDDDSGLLNDAVKHNVQQLQCLVHDSLALHCAIAFEVLQAKLSVTVLIACPEELHVLILDLLIAIIVSATVDVGSIVGALVTGLPRRPPLCLTFRLTDAPKVALLGEAIMVGVEDAEAKLPPHLYVTTLEVCAKCQELLKVNDAIAIEVDGTEECAPQRLVLSVASKQGVKLVLVQWARRQGGSVEAQEEVDLLQVVQLLRVKCHVLGLLTRLRRCGPHLGLDAR